MVTKYGRRVHAREIAKPRVFFLLRVSTFRFSVDGFRCGSFFITRSPQKVANQNIAINDYLIFGKYPNLAFSQYMYQRGTFDLNIVLFILFKVCYLYINV